MKYRDDRTGEEKIFVLPVDLKTEWVAALRSGEYKQTSGALFDGSAYCCLGVLCKIKDRLKQTLVGTTLAGAPRYYWVDKNSNNAVMAYTAEDLLPRGVQYRLAKYNDTGKSFNWIAAYIERYL